MSLYIEDSSLVEFFLRTKITDPRGRITLTESDTQTLSADTIVSVTATENISHIDNLTLDGISLTAFIDYYYDIKNRKIIFFEEQTGDLTFDIYTGTNWIYAGNKRRNDLTNDSFPRISIIYVSRPTNILGNFDGCELINNRFQIDIWTKKDYVATIDLGDYTSNLADNELAMYLGRQIKDKLKLYAWNLTSKHFKDYLPIESPKLKDFNAELNLYNCMYEFYLKSIVEDEEFELGGEGAPEI